MAEGGSDNQMSDFLSEIRKEKINPLTISP